MHRFLYIAGCHAIFLFLSRSLSLSLSHPLFIFRFISLVNRAIYCNKMFLHRSSPYSGCLVNHFTRYQYWTIFSVVNRVVCRCCSARVSTSISDMLEFCSYLHTTHTRTLAHSKPFVNISNFNAFNDWGRPLKSSSLYTQFFPSLLCSLFAANRNIRTTKLHMWCVRTGVLYKWFALFESLDIMLFELFDISRSSTHNTHTHTTIHASFFFHFRSFSILSQFIHFMHARSCRMPYSI